MRQLLLLCLLCLLWITSALAQDDVIPAATEEPDVDATIAVSAPEVRVRVGDAFIRSAPSLDAPPIGSVFLDDPLEIVGRNADGLWYEVRRPNRIRNLGWIFNEMVSDLEVLPEYLPLTNGDADLIGDVVAEDTGVAVFTLAELQMRDGPSLSAGSLNQTVPQSVTVQVVYRNQDSTWVYVNYRGVLGWISTFLIRDNPNLESVPLAPGLPPLAQAQGIVVPPEIQLDQVERLRAFVIASRDVSNQLAIFWEEVLNGQTMPCEPPPFLALYPYTEQDVQQLPELNRLVPRLDTGIENLNSAIIPLTQCGVFDRETVRLARNNAVNAGIIFEASLGRIDIVEDIINAQVEK